MNKVLIAGSGSDLPEVLAGLDLTSFDAIVAINNAWKEIPSELLSFHIFAKDWKAWKDGTVKTDLKWYRNIFGDRLNHDWIVRRYGAGKPGQIGFRRTMIFTASYWALAHLYPGEIHYAGCSMYYPDGEANTFYGEGNPDPLRFPVKRLVFWFNQLERKANEQGCLLYNRGTTKGLLPYSPLTE